MYKTRGKPDDVLNRAATQQEKDLAAAIRINPIKKNEIVPKLDLRERGPSNFQCLKNESRRVIPSKKVSNKVQGRLQKVAFGQLQKPLDMKPVNSYKPRWESSKISELVRDDRYSLEKELEEVSLELNIGNVQLEEIKKLLDGTTRGERSKKFLYNVNKDVEHKPRKNESNSDALGKKTRFLLTLNNVQQRMQKMQCKFFNSNGSRYKSVKDVVVETTDRDNIDADTEIVFHKNEKEIMDSARKSLARRKTLLDDVAEVGPEDPGKKFQSALSDSIMKSSYLKKELKNTINLDVDSSNSHSIDDTLFGKLEQSFTNRPFAKAKPVKSYWPVFNSLKDSLYETK